jgi:hypothetical protein
MTYVQRITKLALGFILSVILFRALSVIFLTGACGKRILGVIGCGQLFVIELFAAACLIGGVAGLLLWLLKVPQAMLVSISASVIGSLFVLILGGLAHGTLAPLLLAAVGFLVSYIAADLIYNAWRTKLAFKIVLIIAIALMACFVIFYFLFY